MSAVVLPLVETLSQEHHEKLTRTPTGGSNKEISEKKADDEPTPAALPFTNSDAPAQPPAFRRTRKYWIVVAAFFYFFFILGLNGGSTGPLLPRYQQFYQVRQFFASGFCFSTNRVISKIDYLTTSIIFVSNACVRPVVPANVHLTPGPHFPQGSLTAAVITHFFGKRLQFSTVRPLLHHVAILSNSPWQFYR
jgi:hypothetical protein